MCGDFLQIRERLSDLRQEGSQLQDTWQNQKDRLDQVLEFQLFLRDAKNIDAMSGAHEVMCGLDVSTEYSTLGTCIARKGASTPERKKNQHKFTAA
jgi:hypothetical protein